MGHSETGCASRKRSPLRHLIAPFVSILSPLFPCQSPLSWCVQLLKSFWGAARKSHQAFNGTLNTPGYIIRERVAEQKTCILFFSPSPGICNIFCCFVQYVCTCAQTWHRIYDSAASTEKKKSFFITVRETYLSLFDVGDKADKECSSFT